MNPPNKQLLDNWPRIIFHLWHTYHQKKNENEARKFSSSIVAREKKNLRCATKSKIIEKNLEMSSVLGGPFLKWIHHNLTTQSNLWNIMQVAAKTILLMHISAQLMMKMSEKWIFKFLICARWKFLEKFSSPSTDFTQN